LHLTGWTVLWLIGGGLRSLVLQEGKHRSLWIWPLSARAFNPTKLETCLQKIDDSRSYSACYVAVPEQLRSESEPAFANADDNVMVGRWIGVLKEQRYRFHHHHEQAVVLGFDSPFGVLVYCKWLKKSESLIPAFATAIEGAGMLVLSPDETQVLLIKDPRFSFFGRIGGAVDMGEGTLEAAMREAHEEVGVQVDESFRAHLALHYNIARSREGRVNEHFDLFIGRAKTLEFKIDTREVEAARWFPVRDLVEAFDHAEAAAMAANESLPKSVSFPDDLAVGSMELFALAQWARKLSRPPVKGPFGWTFY
jgi:8-oxo-dGTP pyrophosphatase MutT (NUDIX family)